MRAVIQRVSRASVTVDGTPVAAIERGLLVLVGIETTDTPAEITRLAEKLVHLRIFEDDAGKMNRSVLEIAGGVLLVPNFTLAGDASKGRRPSFDRAMRPEQAEPMFAELVRAVSAAGVRVGTGVFRAHMEVSLVNDGPITIVIDLAP